jgi:hypothetical protein
VYSIDAQRNYGDMQAILEIRHHLQASFTIVFSRVFYRHRVFPLQLGHKFKRQAALDDIPVIFSRVECYAHPILRYSIN